MVRSSSSTTPRPDPRCRPLAEAAAAGHTGTPPTVRGRTFEGDPRRWDLPRRLDNIAEAASGIRDRPPTGLPGFSSGLRRAAARAARSAPGAALCYSALDLTSSASPPAESPCRSTPRPTTRVQATAGLPPRAADWFRGGRGDFPLPLDQHLFAPRRCRPRRRGTGLLMQRCLLLRAASPGPSGMVAMTSAVGWSVADAFETNPVPHAYRSEHAAGRSVVGCACSIARGFGISHARCGAPAPAAGKSMPGAGGL